MLKKRVVFGGQQNAVPTILLWLAPLLFFALFYVAPIAETFKRAFAPAQSPFDWQAAVDLVWPPLWFTLWQAALSMLLTLVIGLPAAYVFARYSFPGKKLLRVFSSLPFILPTVVVAASFNALAGPNGWINLLLMDLFNLSEPPLRLLNTLGIILIAHVFYNVTVVLRIVGSAWSQIDTRYESAARTLGADSWQAFWQVVFPLLRPSIISAALLVFIFDFSSFGVILMLGGPKFATMEVEIYRQTMQFLDLKAAGILSVVQMVITVALMALSLRVGGTQTSFTPTLSGENERKAASTREKVIVAGMLVTLFLLTTLPLLALIFRAFMSYNAQTETWAFTLRYFQELFRNPTGSIFYVPPIDSAVNSLRYALLTVLISLGLGLPAAYALSRPDRFSRVIDPIIMLPMGTSAVTLGLGFILFFNRPPLDVMSFPLLVPISHSLIALPFVIRTMVPAISSIPPSLRHAAGVLGAAPLRVWWEVDLPIVLKAALVSSIFAFTLSLGEFGATSFIARPEYPTLPVAIYRFLSRPGALNYGQAMAVATLLLALCALALVLLELLADKDRGKG